jgi:hypothetical protein
MTLAMAELLGASCCMARQKPEEAIMEPMAAQDDATVLAHLPKATAAALEKEPQEQRELFLRVFMLSKSLAEEGMEISRSSDDPLVF